MFRGSVQIIPKTLTLEWFELDVETFICPNFVYVGMVRIGCRDIYLSELCQQKHVFMCPAHYVLALMSVRPPDIVSHLRIALTVCMRSCSNLIHNYTIKNMYPGNAYHFGLRSCYFQSQRFI